MGKRLIPYVQFLTGERGLKAFLFFWIHVKRKSAVSVYGTVRIASLILTITGDLLWTLIWKAGKLESWKAGKLESWKAGKLESWKAGKLESWKAAGVEENGELGMGCPEKRILEHLKSEMLVQDCGCLVNYCCRLIRGTGHYSHPRTVHLLRRTGYTHVDLPILAMEKFLGSQGLKSPSQHIVRKLRKLINDDLKKANIILGLRSMLTVAVKDAIYGLYAEADPHYHRILRRLKTVLRDRTDLQVTVDSIGNKYVQLSEVPTLAVDDGAGEVPYEILLDLIDTHTFKSVQIGDYAGMVHSLLSAVTSLADEQPYLRRLTIPALVTLIATCERTLLDCNDHADSSFSLCMEYPEIPDTIEQSVNQIRVTIIEKSVIRRKWTVREADSICDMLRQILFDIVCGEQYALTKYYNTYFPETSTICSGNKSRSLRYLTDCAIREFKDRLFRLYLR